MTPEEELNAKWDNRKIIEETVKSLNMHTEPAPKTLELFAEYGKESKAQTQQIDEIKTILAVQVEKHEQQQLVLQKIVDTTEQTLIQATKTNGRVLALEKKSTDIDEKTKSNSEDINSLKNYRWWFLGVGATLMVVGYSALKGIISTELDQHNKTKADEVVSLLEDKYDLKVNE